MSLRFPNAQSLKQKRALLSPVLDGGRHRFPVAMSEVDNQDSWQLATIGVAAISGSVRVAERTIDEVERYVWSFPDIEVIASSRHWLEAD